jgi:hypothetical protein
MLKISIFLMIINMIYFKTTFETFEVIEKTFQEITQRALCFINTNRTTCKNTLAENFYFKIS